MKCYVTINLIIADDHEIFRDGFINLIDRIPEFKLLGEATNGEELVRMAREKKPDIIITDIKMPKMDGIEAASLIKEEFPNIGIIALTLFDEDHLIVDMLEAGAKGYLLKTAHKQEIIEAVKLVYKDEPYYCKNTTHKLAQLIAKSSFNPYKKITKPEFSEKEIAVIRMICEEKSTKEIAEILQQSQRTIEGYREHILEKTRSKNIAGIVIYAIKKRIYP